MFKTLYMNAFHIFGVALSIFFSLFGLILPKSTAKFLGFNTENSRGDIEVMATYGGFFLGISLLTLFVNTNSGYDVLGGGWLGAGVIRVIALAKYRKFYPLAIALSGMELVIGGILIVF